MTDVFSPAAEDGAVAGASRLIGGPRGRHATGRLWSWGTPLRLLLVVTALVCGAAYFRTSICAAQVPAYQNNYQYTHLCYSDVYVLYGGEGLGSGPGGTQLQVPYADHPVEYPPVMGYLMLGAAAITHAVHPDAGGSGNDPRPLVFFDITALLLGACALFITWGVARLAGAKRVWDAGMVALSPALLMHAFTNWDLAAVALAVGGLWAWAARRPVLAGVLLGLGIATKLFPLLVLVAVAMCCLRANRWRDLLRAVGAAVVAGVAAYVPAMLISGRFQVNGCPGAVAGWDVFFHQSTYRGADWGSFWLLLQHLLISTGVNNAPLDYGASACRAPGALNLASSATVLACAAAVLLLVLRAPRRPRVAQVAFLLLAAFVVFNKIDSPQYVLWLLPFAVLARPRWGAILAWQAAEVVLGAANLYQLIAIGTPGTGLPLWTYLVFLGIRDLVLFWLAGLVVREVRRPERDPVRIGGRDDPAGGILDGAPDGFLVRRRYVGWPQGEHA